MRLPSVLSLVLTGGLSLGCGPPTGQLEHPDDPVINPPGPRAAQDPEPEPAAAAEPSGPGVAYTTARSIVLDREAVPCPKPCDAGPGRDRCAVKADVRFLDLVAQGSHQNVREVLEHTEGLQSCFLDANDTKAKTLLSFRIPLDFVVGPDGAVRSRDDPMHDPDPQLEEVLACVGTWLDELHFEGVGRDREAKVRLQLEPVSYCRE